MAEMQNNRAVMGVAPVSSPAQRLYNGLPVIGAVSADGEAFAMGRVVIPTKAAPAGVSMYNYQPVRGVYLVPVGVNMHNGLPVLPMSGLTSPVDPILPIDPSEANIFIDASVAPIGPVTSLTMLGTNPITVTPSGTGAGVEMTSEGILFSGGQFLRATTGLPSGTYRKAAIALDMTLTAAPLATTYAFLLDLTPAGSRSEVRLGWGDNAVPSAGYQAGAYGAGGVLLRGALYKPIGRRFVVTFSFDYETGEIVMVDDDGFATTALGIAPELMALNDIRIGQGASMVLHRAAVFLEI